MDSLPLVQSHPHHEHNVTRHLSAISPESLNVPGTDHTTHQHATKDTTLPLVSPILIASGSQTIHIGSRAQLCACSWSVSVVAGQKVTNSPHHLTRTSVGQREYANGIHPSVQAVEITAAAVVSQGNYDDDDDMDEDVDKRG